MTTAPPWLAREIDRAASLRYSASYVDAVLAHLAERKASGNFIVSAVLSMNSTQPVLDVVYTNHHVDDEEAGSDKWHVTQRSSLIGGRQVQVQAIRLDSFWHGVLSGVGGPGPVEYLMRVLTGVNLVRSPKMEDAALATVKHEEWADSVTERLLPSLSCFIEQAEAIEPAREKMFLRDVVKTLRPAATESLAAILLSASSDLVLPFDAVREPLDGLQGSPMHIANLLAVADVRLIDRATLDAGIPAYASFCQEFRATVIPASSRENEQGWKTMWRDSFSTVIDQAHAEAIGN